MRRGFIILILLSLHWIPMQGQRILQGVKPLSDSAFASILTCGPGNEMYESFGHTAIRVCDSTQGFDVVFNYGTFDFEEPHFYLRFARGMLKYCVEAQHFYDIKFEYQYFGRAVWEQRLILTKSELDKLFDALRENAKPENKFYKYDFFRDNCATRVRDMIENALEGRSFLNDNYPQEETSYRDLLYKYTDSTLMWWRLGLDLVLGTNCDRIMNKMQYMYVPVEMMVQYDTSLASDGQRLAEPAVQLLPEMRTPVKSAVSPTLCFWLLFIIVLLLTFIARHNGWHLFWLDGILFGSAFAVSLLMLFLWFCSDHWCAETNLNLLWANPLYILLILRLRQYNPINSLILVSILLLTLMGWALWPQHFNAAVLPITLTLATRLVDRLTDKNKYIIKNKN